METKKDTFPRNVIIVCTLIFIFVCLPIFFCGHEFIALFPTIIVGFLIGLSLLELTGKPTSSFNHKLWYAITLLCVYMVGCGVWKNCGKSSEDHFWETAEGHYRAVNGHNSHEYTHWSYGFGLTIVFIGSVGIGFGLQIGEPKNK